MSCTRTAIASCDDEAGNEFQRGGADVWAVRSGTGTLCIDIHTQELAGRVQVFQYHRGQLHDFNAKVTLIKYCFEMSQKVCYDHYKIYWPKDKFH